MTKRSATDTHRARILIVDDHPLVRSGLRLLIDCEPDLAVCGEAANVADAMRLLETQRPDLLIVDLSLKDSSGLELIKRIKSRNSDVKMLVSSMFEESLYAERVLSAGALGYVHKQEGMERVIEAIRCVLSGRVWLSSAMSDRMLRRMTASQPAPTQSPVHTLSDRELEVFEQIGRGRSTKDIARQLHLSIKTVETHREKIKAKLGLRSAAELSRAAYQWVSEQGG
ncbi:MAG TPA: response regulator transcription factor [Planctomycetaceae bacterium]|nr:response regulator transcription factor [Planctomycetaceae bacterium]